jgi:hypothetical protein
MSAWLRFEKNAFELMRVKGKSNASRCRPPLRRLPTHVANLNHRLGNDHP